MPVIVAVNPKGGVGKTTAARLLGTVLAERGALVSLILLTRTNPQIPTKAERMIVEDLVAAGVSALKTHLHQRTAYQAMFAYKLALHELLAGEVNGLPAASANAQAFAAEVTETINNLFERVAA